MKITYDKKADALYVRFQNGQFKKNKEIEEGVVLDIGKENALLGVEILNASTRVNIKNLNQFATREI